MIRPITLLCLLFTLGLPRNTPAASWHTAANGSWTAPATWSNGLVPALTGSDSIFVTHDVMYNTSVNLITSTYVRIDTGASLCGHRRFIVQQGSQLDNYGDLYADSLIINGGLVINYGFIDLTNSAVIGSGGSLQNSGSMVIGQSFLCSEKPQTLPEAENHPVFLDFYPNPAQNGQKISLNASKSVENRQILIISTTGKLIKDQPIDQNGAFTPEGLTAGLYFIQLVEKGEIVGRGKLLIVD